MSHTGSDPPALEASPKRKSQDPIWTILPSYYMYHSTFSGEETDPPRYTEDPEETQNQGYSESESASRVLSIRESNDVTAPTSVVNSEVSGLVSERRASSVSGSSGDGSFIVADESSSSWRETILDNLSHLRNLTRTKNKMASAVKISIHYTKDVGQRGVEPEIIDPSLYEYKQGDYLNGFIYIKNEGTEPIPFDMFYVLFDGNFIVADKDNVKSRRPVKIRKFLEMYDFAASWNPAFVDRLVSEEINKYYCPNFIDPLDGSHLSIGPEKIIEPGILYKRFFTFRIPTRLLDSECNDHNLSGHTELPPTLGLSRDEKEQWTAKDQVITDFSFVDTSISHGLWARFIGKASKYGATETDNKGFKLINAKGDEFVILKEAGSFIRILQETKILSDREKRTNNEISRVMYESFVNQIKETIAIGNEMLKVIEGLDSGDKLDNARRLEAIEAAQRKNHDDATKLRQLYHPSSSARDVKFRESVPKTYDVVINYRRKQVLGKGKEIGSILLSTPRIDYLLSYISPKRFRTRGPIDPSSWKVEVPIELTFSPSSLRSDADLKPPEIQSVFGELVVFTIKSNKRPIPVELNHDFLFKNNSKMSDEYKSEDNFTHIVKLPMQQYATQVYNLFKTLGADNMQLSKGMVEDLAALSKVDEKYNKLVITDLQAMDESGKVEPCTKGIKLPWRQVEGGQFKKKFSLVVDVTKARKMSAEKDSQSPTYKAYDEFTLVPSFQTCLMSRLYYFRFVIRFAGHQSIEVKLPVTIAKAATE